MYPMDAGNVPAITAIFRVVKKKKQLYHEMQQNCYLVILIPVYRTIFQKRNRKTIYTET